MADVDKDAKIIWDYMLMKQPLKKCDAVLVLGSIDERVVKYGTGLFLKGYGKWLIISGGLAHGDDLLATNWGKSEAEHFADIALGMGVKEGKIILETKAENTGENAKFTREVLKDKNIIVSSILIIQKPYMERRAYATFKKQWPGVDFVVTSPPLSYQNYFDKLNSRDQVLNIMAGDLQRIKEYPKSGFQIEQEIPARVWSAYKELVSAGYDKHLISS